MGMNLCAIDWVAISAVATALMAAMTFITILNNSKQWKAEKRANAIRIISDKLTDYDVLLHLYYVKLYDGFIAHIDILKSKIDSAKTIEDRIELTYEEAEEIVNTHAEMLPSAKKIISEMVDSIKQFDHLILRLYSEIEYLKRPKLFPFFRELDDNTTKLTDLMFLHKGLDELKVLDIVKDILAQKKLIIIIKMNLTENRMPKTKVCE